ncbi:MAG TPA: portal protein, partial [Candidatus Paceibacterota bacterium]
MEDTLGKYVVTRFEKEDGKRGTWKSLWQSCMRYAMPNEASFQETITPGTERTRYILDSTAPRSLELFASFLHSLLNNPGSKWIKMGVEGEDETKYSLAERSWFEQVAATMQASLEAPKADIYSQLHQVYLMMGSVGTACGFI